MLAFFFASMQLLYLLIIGATYYFIATSSFRYIPGYYLSEVHRYRLYPQCLAFCARMFVWFKIRVLAGTQASWQLGSAFSSLYWQAFLIQEWWILIMFLSIFLFILMITSSSLKKNVPPAKFLSEHHLSGFTTFKTFKTVWTRYNLFHLLLSDLPGPNTAAFVIVVLLGLTIIVRGWFVHYSFFYGIN